MRHTLVKLAGLLLALTLVLSGCNLIGIDQMKVLDEDFAKLDKDYATVVAEYDGGTVTKGEVMGIYNQQYAYYQQMVQMYNSYGMNMTISDSDRETMKQQAMEYAVQNVALDKQFESRGLSISDEKLEEIETTVKDNYQQAYDSFYANITEKDEAIHARQAEYDMYANGFTEQLFRDLETAQAKHELVEENVRAEIGELTDDELKEAYDKQVADDETAYADSASAFESAMSNADTLVAWMPEGYRTVKHILVKPEDDAVLTAVTDARSALTSAESKLADFQSELADLNAPSEETEAAEDTETEEAEAAEAEPSEAPRTAEEIQADIDAAQADVDAAKAEVEKAEAACLDAVKAKTDEIYAKLEAGEDFASLIAEYGEDPGMENEPTATRGYYVAENSANWDKNFTAGAMALANVGDVSETPVISTSGVHIIRYESDVTPGAVALEDIRDALYEKALDEAKTNHFSDELTAWTEALNPVYHLDAFKTE